MPAVSAVWARAGPPPSQAASTTRPIPTAIPRRVSRTMPDPPHRRRARLSPKHSSKDQTSTRVAEGAVLRQFASPYFVARSPGMLDVQEVRLASLALSRLVWLATCHRRTTWASAKGDERSRARALQLVDGDRLRLPFDLHLA